MDPRGLGDSAHHGPFGGHDGSAGQPPVRSRSTSHPGTGGVVAGSGDGLPSSQNEVDRGSNLCGAHALLWRMSPRMNPGARGHLTGSCAVATWATTGRGHVVTQGDAAFAASTHRDSSMTFQRVGPVAESRAEHPRDDRSSWQERMGLTVEGPSTTRARRHLGRRGRGRARPRGPAHGRRRPRADPLAGAGADVLVVLRARLPRPARQLPCPGRAAGLDGHRGARRLPAHGSPAPVPGEILAEADRRGLPIWPSPPACDWTRSCPRCWAPSSTSRARPWLSSRMDDEFIGVALEAAGSPRSPTGWPSCSRASPCSAWGPTATSSPPPAHPRRSRRSATGCGSSTQRPTTRSPS